MPQVSPYQSLSPGDQGLAILAGRGRYTRRRASGSVHRWNRNPNDHTVEGDIAAVGAEIFAARLALLDWHDSHSPDPQGDIGPGIQVRYTPRPHGCLLIHDEDIDDHFFFLVVGDFPNYRLPGWIVAKDGKQRHWFKNTDPTAYRPCYYVPQYFLRSLSEWLSPLGQL